MFNQSYPKNDPRFLSYCIASIAGLERGDRIQKFRKENNLTPPTPTGTTNKSSLIAISGGPIVLERIIVTIVIGNCDDGRDGQATFKRAENAHASCS
ncbi:hypothetical protein EVAR_62031_1 [Eumeta japonica]|uniref:Uncharacterized protein n=1 Tax=Eumeta variegata TaxID=151549 RepID=A0A4C1ZGZ6_EUMVA|nr:hypothetical protein EVAR_62031_1 [Eumeta japonica]